MKYQKRIVAALLCIVLLGVIVVYLVRGSVKVQATDLMKEVSVKSISGKMSDDAFISSSANFAVELFKKTVDDDKSSLISPLSVMLALSMTANGADAQTKEEMQTLLGGKIPLDDLNEYLYSYVKNLPSENKYKLKIANSIWFEKRLTVERDFLEKNADYYGAQAYQSTFDNQTAQDINNWVKDKTDGKIDKIINKIDGNTVMYLINAIAFDAEWQNVYTKNSIHTGKFTTFDGTNRDVQMMSSTESRYIDDGKVTGFIKNYKDTKYSFVALLPNKDISIGDYIASLTGESLLSTIKNSQNTSVMGELPKFSYDYSYVMNDALKKLGMKTAFDSDFADFSKICKLSNGSIYISEVLHKTYISVDELGTKAGAATKVEMKENAAPIGKSVVLNRPFVYAIIDNSTNLPIFIGNVLDIVANT